MKKQHFYAKGKLLISGEYLVLKGARALAVPLKFGQDLQVEIKEEKSNPLLYWKSYENNLLWFEAIFSLPNFELIETSDRLVADRLLNIFKIAIKHKPAFISKGQSYIANSQMNFDRNWGLGSSSTLISNISNWADVDPYDLLKGSFGGSGYDIACASADKPIFYKLDQKGPLIKTVDFFPIFHQNLYFVSLGKKQSSAESIQQFELGDIKSELFIPEISEISSTMAKTDDFMEFQKLMRRHEEIISMILNKKRIKEERFADFPGEIKSLGAWGGDFILAATEQNAENVKLYFKNKNLDIVFGFREMVISC